MKTTNSMSTLFGFTTMIYLKQQKLGERLIQATSKLNSMKKEMIKYLKGNVLI